MKNVYCHLNNLLTDFNNNVGFHESLHNSFSYSLFFSRNVNVIIHFRSNFQSWGIRKQVAPKWWTITESLRCPKQQQQMKLKRRKY